MVARLQTVRDAARSRRRRGHRAPGTTPPAKTAARLLESDLAGGEVHELRVLVPNRPGIVAEIALALGRATIDIVDMGSVSLLRLAWHGRAVDPRRASSPSRPNAWCATSGWKWRAREAALLARRRVARHLRAPGDKSMSHRAALFGAMCADPVHVTGYLDAADTRSTLAAVRGLGALVEEGAPGDADDPRAGAARRAAGARRRRQRRHADAAAAGLARRPAGGEWTFDGDESIRRRPVDRIARPLREMGARIDAREDRFAPFTVYGSRCRASSTRSRSRPRRSSHAC